MVRLLARSVRAFPKWQFLSAVPGMQRLAVVSKSGARMCNQNNLSLIDTHGVLITQNSYCNSDC